MDNTAKKVRVKSCIMKPNEYPYVFVSGMAGWGEKSKINDSVPYWGCSFNLMSFLRENGICSAVSSISPLGSAWDRACELYAELTGTRVDYGKAHSEKFGHERYGVLYEKPLIPCFGKKNASGNVKKINIIAHSFGGNTARLLSFLLEKGSAEERAATTDGSLSPLFKGGNGGLIFSITTMCTPHNGTTLQPSMSKSVGNFIMMCYHAVNDIVANSAFEDWYLVRLEHFGIGSYHRQRHGTSFMNRKEVKHFATCNDNVFYDVSLEATQNANLNQHILDDVYYFSYSVCGTVETRKNDTVRHMPGEDIFPLLQLFCRKLGRYTNENLSGINVNEEWLANDGLVNTISQRAPFTEASVEFDDNMEIKKGIWHVMPTIKGNHGTVIGLSSKIEDTKNFFMTHINRINNLPH